MSRRDDQKLPHWELIFSTKYRIKILAKESNIRWTDGYVGKSFLILSSLQDEYVPSIRYWEQCDHEEQIQIQRNDRELDVTILDIWPFCFQVFHHVLQNSYTGYINEIFVELLYILSSIFFTINHFRALTWRLFGSIANKSSAYRSATS